MKGGGPHEKGNKQRDPCQRSDLLDGVQEGSN